MRDREFDRRNEEMVEAMIADAALSRVTQEWLERSFEYEYSYHFEWFGLPIIQYPQDIVAVQEIIWRTHPSVVVEAGIARGGSLVMYASLLSMLGGRREVIGIDIDIRDHNRAAIENHELSSMITLIEGSSVDRDTVERVVERIGGTGPVMVVLDSNHTSEHVLAELNLYGPLVTPGCYMVVFDTLVEELPERLSRDRPWGPGDNPATAIAEYLEGPGADLFVVDREVSDRLLITAARNGYLRRI